MSMGSTSAQEFIQSICDISRKYGMGVAPVEVCDAAVKEVQRVIDGWEQLAEKTTK